VKIENLLVHSRKEAAAIQSMQNAEHNRAIRLALMAQIVEARALTFIPDVEPIGHYLTDNPSVSVGRPPDSAVSGNLVKAQGEVSPTIALEVTNTRVVLESDEVDTIDHVPLSENLQSNTDGQTAKETKPWYFSIF
jgi:hypothetical protein